MELRLAIFDDAEALREIYNHEVTTSTATFDLVPRSLDEQRAWQAERSGARAVLVAVDDGVVGGFASLSPWRDRPACRRETALYQKGTPACSLGPPARLARRSSTASRGERRCESGSDAPGGSP